jgi:DNA-binding IclR family transcriptional regulator
VAVVTAPGSESRRRELLRLFKGSPTPEVSVETAARRIGIPLQEAHDLVAELESEGLLRREGKHILVVEPAASRAGDRPIP